MPNLIQPESDRLDDYFAETTEVDCSDPAVRSLATKLRAEAEDDVAFARAAFEYVRDRVAHSWDIQADRVVCSASETLQYGHGICYAKSNLLCAILRSQGVPAGFCYQRLTLGDAPDTGYCIHALNAAFLGSPGRWIRLDARGNKPGIDARFSLDEEKLAFPIRADCDEIDYPTVYARPHPMTIDALRQSPDVRALYLSNLPDRL